MSRNWTNCAQITSARIASAPRAGHDRRAAEVSASMAGIASTRKKTGSAARRIAL